jgi:N-acetyl-1-D-myo-inositol-2-amino-2-deoxy-alpha-D-glucopyranoside deacetylase
MRAHASQTPPYDAMPVEMQRAFLRVDRLRRIDPVWTGGPTERDWMPRLS